MGSQVNQGTGTKQAKQTYKADMRRFWQILLKTVIIYAVISVIAGIALAELSLHLYHKKLTHQHQFEQRFRPYGAHLQPLEIRAADGAVLRGWYSVPANDNGKAVILLHGITDNREGIAGFGEMFLARGYRVLLPDSRAHGESGGAVATYGLLEADDIHRWVSLLYDRGATCVDGFGASLGAALVLESMGVERRYCAVVADSPFSTFRRVAYDREGFFVGLGPWFGRSFGLLPTEVALRYAEWRYGYDLQQANPLDAVKDTSTPVLLIHGTADINILPRHSVIIAKSNPDHIQLWMIPGAHHTTTAQIAGDEYGRRVLTFFESHDQEARRAASQRLPD